MISAWKLKRETKRVAAQLSAIPLLIYEPFAQKLYDRNFEKNIKLYQGIRNLGKQVAVFLIYQPRGLADSIYLTVDHLVASGFEVVIVSNCPLASADLEKLYLRTALVVERPNFGYDFGGYRDAVVIEPRRKGRPNRRPQSQYASAGHHAKRGAPGEPELATRCDRDALV